MSVFHLLTVSLLQNEREGSNQETLNSSLSPLDNAVYAAQLSARPQGVAIAALVAWDL